MKSDFTFLHNTHGGITKFGTQNIPLHKNNPDASAVRIVFALLQDEKCYGLLLENGMI